MRREFWGWVVLLGLKAKAQSILAGLDKDGRPLRPLKPKSRKYRRSQMTSSHKGDPAAPPLIPGWQKSRTYSLLAGRPTYSQAEFFWRFDPWTGDSWGKVLAYQAEQGRDTIGISDDLVAQIKERAWRKWDTWKTTHEREKRIKPVAQEAARRVSVPEPSAIRVEPASGVREPTKGGSGGRTIEQWEAYFRRSALAKPPGRPQRPRSLSEIVGPNYNRIVRATWDRGSGRGGNGAAAPRPPKPGPRISPPRFSPPAIKPPSARRKSD